MTMARILISMPDEFLNKVDSVADGEQRSRSELIREALRSYIRRSRITNVEKAKSNAEILEQILD
jgi:metal-responsive CopG/Arc/MetJ family transcriptional regulator